jgi:hypothetical protein
VGLEESVYIVVRAWGKIVFYEIMWVWKKVFTLL